MATYNKAIRFAAEPLRSIAFGAIGVGYAAIGVPFVHPIRMLSILNNTDAILTFSYDGVNDHFVLGAGSAMILDLTSNKSIPMGFYIAENSSIWVKELGVPTQESVYVSAYYGAD